MTDSDDEFLSASEGEDDFDGVIPPKSTSQDHKVPIQESTLATEFAKGITLLDDVLPSEVSSSSIYHSLRPESSATATEEKVQTVVEENKQQFKNASTNPVPSSSSSQDSQDGESLGDFDNSQDSISNESESEKSLSSEKKLIIAEEIKETTQAGLDSDSKEKEVAASSPIVSRLDVKAVSVPTTVSKPESSVAKGKLENEDLSIDESEASGWDNDDWGVDDKEEPSVVKQVAKTKKEKPAVRSKARVDSRSTSVLDEQEDKKEEKLTEGWDDWSLVDEKKLPKVDSAKDMWTRDKTEIKKPSESKVKEGSSSWGWSGIVSAVGDSFTSTIESSLGFPSPEEMVRRNQAITAKLKEEENEQKTEKEEEELTEKPSTVSGFGGFSLLSGFVSGGIDVLETIGKKTFETITVSDPKKGGSRRLIFQDNSSQNLSDVLRELRAREESEKSETSGHQVVQRPDDVATLFEKSEGMAHLEALEMLSNNRGRADPKFEKTFMKSLEKVEVDAGVVESSDFERNIIQCIKNMKLPYDPVALVKTVKDIDSVLDWCDGKDGAALLTESVQSLTSFTASCVHIVSKLANLMLIMGGECDYSHFVHLYGVLARQSNSIASRYTSVIGESIDAAEADELCTQVLMEASTSVDFIRQAHRLLIPMFAL